MHRNDLFAPEVVQQIESYAAMWNECMPKTTDISFQLQHTENGWRTVVLNTKNKTGTVTNDARFILAFSEPKDTPNEGWNPKLLDQYAFLLKPALKFITDLSVMQEIASFINRFSDVKELTKGERRQLLALIRKGRFNLHEVLKDNVHVNLFFKVIKNGRKPERYLDGYALYLTDRNFKEVEEEEE